MKNTEIHQGLDKADVRDVIAKGLIHTYENDNVEHTFYGDSQLQQAEKRLRIAHANLESIKIREAFKLIMETLGWEEFDVSDETVIEFGHKYYMPFIGTQLELDNLFDNLLERIRNEKQ